MFEIPGFIDATTLAAFQDIAARSGHFISGERTAGWHARERKHNLQAEPAGMVVGMLAKIEQLLLAHDVVVAAARPKNIIKLMLNRYDQGMSYGNHIDDALMDGQRSDMSFTLFLSTPEDYDGGELIIDDSAGERHIKLDAGSLFLYPSNTLHRVDPVTRGTRLAVVGWIRSYIRDPHQREILLDLEQAIHQLRNKTPSQAEALTLLLKSRSNLLRLWADA